MQATHCVISLPLSSDVDRENYASLFLLQYNNEAQWLWSRHTLKTKSCIASIPAPPKKWYEVSRLKSSLARVTRRSCLISPKSTISKSQRSELLTQKQLLLQDNSFQAPQVTPITFQHSYSLRNMHKYQAKKRNAWVLEWSIQCQGLYEQDENFIAASSTSSKQVRTRFTKLKDVSTSRVVTSAGRFATPSLLTQF